MPQLHGFRSNINECVDTLDPSDYERLCAIHKKEIVDYQIDRIKAGHYKGYMTFDRIDLFCREYESRQPVSPPTKKNSFNNFPQRNYPPGFYDELERKMLVN